MKTEVIMKRELFGCEISQNSKSEFFSATELVRAGNLWRLQNNLPQFNLNSWASTHGAKEFIAQLEKKYGKVKINSKGKNQHTWVHPYLFIDIALAISPQLKIEVYDWMFDKLIQYRNESGDSYKKMAGALYLTYGDKRQFPAFIAEVANRIRQECNVTDWQTASENQLKLRDKIHEYISIFADILREKNNLLNIAIKKAKED